MSRLEGGLNGLKADPPARADDQDCRHGALLPVARPARHHVRCRQLHYKMGGKLETLHRTAGPYSPSNADRGGTIPLRLIEQTDWTLKNLRSRGDRSIEAFRAEADS